MSFKVKHRHHDDAELNITSFMNLMIVLVPVLLLSLTFTQIRVHNINLPDLTGGSTSSDASQSQLEVLVSNKGFKIYYPTKNLVKEIPAISTPQGQALDFVLLGEVMQELKKQLSTKKDVLILSSANLSYQSLVSTMDAVKSYKTVVAASLVEVELFPEISLGDAS